MVKAFKITVAAAAMAGGALSLTLRRRRGTVPLSAPVSLDLASERSSVARLRRARSMWLRHHRLRRRSITGPWLTGRRHGHPAGMTIARGVIQASTRKRDISSARTGHPISAARAFAARFEELLLGRQQASVGGVTTLAENQVTGGCGQADTPDWQFTVRDKFAPHLRHITWTGRCERRLHRLVRRAQTSWHKNFLLRSPSPPSTVERVYNLFIEKTGQLLAHPTTHLQRIRVPPL